MASSTMRNIFSIIAAALISAVALAQSASTGLPPVPTVAGVPARAQRAAGDIDPERIRASVKYLADDKLEGRGPGTAGDRMAAKYLSEQFASYGLTPAGDNGSWYQKVPLYAVRTVPEKTSFQLVPKGGVPLTLQYGAEFVTNNQTGAAVAEIDAPIVFVGYGIRAPEYNWDDYKGVDVRGKVALVIVNEPPSENESFFKGEALTYYGRWTYKYEEAARQGAVGVLIIHREDLASYPWQVVRSSWSGEKSYLVGDPNAKLEAAAWVQHDVAEKIAQSAGHGIDDWIEQAGKGNVSRETTWRLKAHIVSEKRSFDSENVVGMVAAQGAGPQQSVLYTAHFDHLGMDKNLPGDKIYNGAADNATGCGILLEMARAYADAAKAGTPPPHRVYFAAVTAEEQGLLGSQYLGMHPPVPDKDLTLDLNYDMLLPVGVPTSTEVSGAERTTFYPTVESTAKDFDLTIQPDQFPGAGHYYRSDHFSLARYGIPAFSIGQGTLFAEHDASWGAHQMKQYTAERYHQPSDEYKPEMDFRGDARMAQFGFDLGWLASGAKTTQGWQAGDEFEAARKKSSGQ
ncbi:MAG TPA: M28 family peptidase [Acidobacteriaceae bacterium]|jgi:Zn-dependent M28 family amino/carboxypeptidase